MIYQYAEGLLGKRRPLTLALSPGTGRGKNPRYRSVWLALFGAVAMTLVGCSSIRRTLPDPVSVEYHSGDSLPALSKVHRTGDFGLYFGHEKNPQMPVRVAAGEQIGFIRGGDGALKAVAGDFRMNVSKEVEMAHWKRMNYASD